MDRTYSYFPGDSNDFYHACSTRQASRPKKMARFTYWFIHASCFRRDLGENESLLVAAHGLRLFRRVKSSGVRMVAHEFTVGNYRGHSGMLAMEEIQIQR